MLSSFISYEPWITVASLPPGHSPLKIYGRPREADVLRWRAVRNMTGSTLNPIVAATTSRPRLRRSITVNQSISPACRVQSIITAWKCGCRDTVLFYFGVRILPKLENFFPSVFWNHFILQIAHIEFTVVRALARTLRKATCPSVLNLLG